jgi:uncharacterized protein YpmS
MFWTLIILTVLGIVLYHFLIVERRLLRVGSSEEEEGEERFIQRIEEKKGEALRMKQALAELVAMELAEWEKETDNTKHV